MEPSGMVSVKQCKCFCEFFDETIYFHYMSTVQDYHPYLIAFSSYMLMLWTQL